MASQLRIVHEEVAEASLLSRLVNVVMMAAMRLAPRSRLYWLPTGRSFLRLGETILTVTVPSINGREEGRIACRSARSVTCIQCREGRQGVSISGPALNLYLAARSSSHQGCGLSSAFVAHAHGRQQGRYPHTGQNPWAWGECCIPRFDL